MSGELNRDYEIGQEIGRGRFGVVHRCTSRSTGETFAVKSVDRSNLADDLDRELAELEPKLAQLAGAGNPGVVQVHAVYEDDSWTHVVMDLCSGPDLLEWVRQRRGAPVPEPVAADIVAQVAQALALCHRRGVAHRDIKPDNIVLDVEEEDGGENVSPRARLADFGSAAWIGADGGRAEGPRGHAPLRGARGGLRRGLRREGGRVERRGGDVRAALRWRAPLRRRRRPGRALGGDARERQVPPEAVLRRVSAGQGPHEAHDVPRRVATLLGRASPTSPVDRERRRNPSDGAANLKSTTRGRGKTRR